MIDADALTMNASTGCTDYVADELAEWVLGASTVDAIPMDWLKQSRDKLRTMGEYQQDCADAIEFVLRLWQKEQGARA